MGTQSHNPKGIKEEQTLFFFLFFSIKIMSMCFFLGLVNYPVIILLLVGRQVNFNFPFELWFRYSHLDTCF